VNQRALYGALIALGGLWLSAIVAAPLLAADSTLLPGLLYAFFDPVCHQIAERSFHLAGEPLAVCHRCTGLYVGLIVGLLLAPLLSQARDWILEEPRRLLIFVVPVLLDWVWPGNVPLTRFLTGLIATLPVATLLWEATYQLSRPTATIVEGET